MRRYPTEKAINSLIKKLNLPETDQFSQDWEYEVANPKRICEFMSYYEKNITDEDEKFTLMIIIIESFNDALEEEIFDETLWERIKTCLVRDINIHKDTIDYWSLDDEELDFEDYFAITPLIREIKEIL